MKILIAGGSGYLGQAITEQLLKENHEVTILSRNPDKLKWQVYGSQIATWNPRDPKSFARQIEQAEVVINLAGESIAGESLLGMRWTPKRKEAILSTRKLVGRALVEAISSSKKKPRIFVQASAIGFYGPRDNEALDESASPGNDFLSQVVREWEATTEEIESLGIRRVVIRTGLVFGAKAKILDLLKLPFLLFAGGRVGNGRQIMSWIHLEDWIRAVIFLIESKEATGTFNLTAPNPVSNQDFAKSLGRVLKRPSFFPTPGFALRFALGEAATLALDGQNVLPKKLKDLGFSFSFPVLEPALENIIDKAKCLRRQFRVDATLSKVINYHRNTAILKRLTPLPIIVQFHQVEKVHEGSKALFTLWFGPIPVRWNARHHNFLEGVGFTDTQDEGPFFSWVHVHRFFQGSGGKAIVQDVIEYKLGQRGFSWVISRFMHLTLPMLFRYRAWRTKRDLEI